MRMEQTADEKTMGQPTRMGFATTKLEVLPNVMLDFVYLLNAPGEKLRNSPVARDVRHGTRTKMPGH